MEEQKQTLLQNALRNGLILGAIAIALTAVVYVIDYTLMVDWKFGLISFAVYLGFAIYAGFTYRKQTDGFISFGNAFLHSFIVFALSGLLSTVFTIVLYTVVDPELPKKLADVTMENTLKMMEGFGVSGDQIDKAAEKAKKDTENRFTGSGLAKGYIWVLVGSAVLSLIVGLVVRKKEPEERV